MTAQAIETAIKNEAKMTGYTIEQSKVVATSYIVIKPNTNGKEYYIVDTTPGFRLCTCPQFKNEGVCKHQLHVDNHLMVCEQEAEYDAREDAKYEMTAGKF